MLNVAEHFDIEVCVDNILRCLTQCKDLEVALHILQVVHPDSHSSEAGAQLRD